MALSGKRSRLYARILLILMVAFLVAGACTKIIYPCSSGSVPAGESVSNCFSFEKAIMHPADLMNNMQNSLVQFTSTIFLVALLLFAASLVITKYRHKS